MSLKYKYAKVGIINSNVAFFPYTIGQAGSADI